jgi:hypothetical protein
VIPLQKALQEPQLWNRYAYVKNNPLRYTDPDGRCIWDLCIGEIAAATELSAATVAAFEATSAATAWMLSPPGRNATKALVADTASLITSAIDRFNIGSLWAESSPRVFEPNPKHGLTERGDVGAAPTNGQSALDDSVQVKGTSPRRVGVDRLNREIVVLDEHTPGKFHGHVREWEKLTDEMRNALIRSRLTDRRGNILPQEPK